MSEINYYNIQTSIESKTCPEHGKHPKFTKTPEGFSINACCENFRSVLMETAQEAITKETQEAIERMMKGIFKR
ncbi:hypothetical protein CMT75_12385 [Elizabethkingia anophelis]|nr:hypothetical protein [Elizabethkingia anophelis]MDV3777485.1 hypothetical protein [Elizabethkingia anophelis]MDV3838921.1 hypothetical protein [Elizabethkingia anophelis]MDV3949310.1 hypothetical protein [Elizabethkingia anophelis]